MSYAMLLETPDTNGIWSIARGLARNVADYKAHLADCDMCRRSNLDGRGNLSEEALGRFTEFFLTTCIDQVSFMEEIVQPNRLRDRILMWTEEEIHADRLPPKSRQVVEAILYRDQLTLGEIPRLLGTSERHARRITLTLVDHEVLTSESTLVVYHRTLSRMTRRMTVIISSCRGLRNPKSDRSESAFMVLESILIRYGMQRIQSSSSITKVGGILRLPVQ